MQKIYQSFTNITFKIVIMLYFCFFNYFCESKNNIFQNITQENCNILQEKCNIFPQNDSILEKNVEIPAYAGMTKKRNGMTDEENDNILQENDNTLDKNIKYVAENDFIYADMKRYILIGGLPQAETKLKILPAAIFGTTLTGAFIAQHILQMKTIWKNHTSNFKVMDDLKQELYLDKLGHFYGAYISSYTLREALIASGVSWNASNNIAAGLGLSYSTYVEILDGYGEDWGFSPSDFIADVVGAIFFAAQNYIPALQNISPKFMYVPSKWTGYEPRIPHDMFIDDYSSQFFFYSVNIYNLLPDNWKKYYPNWLELSIGYTVRNMLDAHRSNETPCSECIAWQDGYYGSPRLVLSLDYNLMKLLPDGGNTWNWFKQTLNLFKLPSPALEIGKVTRFYLLFPFKLW